MIRRSKLAVMLACLVCGPGAAAAAADGAAELDATRPLERIALGSCVKQDRPQPIWEAVAAFRPDALLLLGDTIYGDTEDMAELRAKYAVLAADPGFAAVRRAAGIVAVWDDHDYGVNDGGSEYPRKRESQQVFLDFFGVPADSPLRSQEGTYRSITVGPPGRRVQLVCLDTRYHRSPLATIPRQERAKGQGPYRPTDDPSATVLGAAQWRWLAGVLREPADLRIVLSSIQLAAIDHHWETWGNFPSERARLFQTIREAGARGVVVVSGDRHSAEISRIAAGNDALEYPLYDLTASSFNQPRRSSTPDEPNRHRLGDRYHDPNFGSIEIAWGDGNDEGALTLAIRDAAGTAVRQETVPLRSLGR